MQESGDRGQDAAASAAQNCRLQEVPSFLPARAGQLATKPAAWALERLGAPLHAAHGGLCAFHTPRFHNGSRGKR